jgi:hypothetical protein
MRRSSAILVPVRIFIQILMENPLQIVHEGSLSPLRYTIHSVPNLILQISFIPLFGDSVSAMKATER